MEVRIVHARGTANGPCIECDHPECIADRQQAAKVCDGCGQSIGYNQPYYLMVDGTVLHTNPGCVLRVAEQRR